MIMTMASTDWARWIKNNQWKDFNYPPNLPMITGKVSRKEKGGNAVTVVDTLATAAVAIIKELKKDPTAPASDVYSRWNVPW